MLCYPLSVSFVFPFFFIDLSLSFSSSRPTAGPRCSGLLRRCPALLIKITLPRSGEISAAKFMKLSRFIVLNELAFPKRSSPDKGCPVNPRRGYASAGAGGGGRPPRATPSRRENHPGTEAKSELKLTVPLVSPMVDSRYIPQGFRAPNVDNGVSFFVRKRCRCASRSFLGHYLLVRVFADMLNL